jgi:hypothetical protein
VANFEALWVARNVLYFPVAARAAADALGLELEVEGPGGGMAPLRRLSLRELLNVRPSAALDLWEALWASGPREEILGHLKEHSLQALGYQDYSARLATRFDDVLPPRWCSWPPRPTTRGRRSCGRWGSARTSSSSCRWTTASAWTRGRSGRPCST